MRIGKLAERSEVPPKTIRYYESIGLLPPAARMANGYRDYDTTAVDRLAFVQRAKASGLTLAEIRSVISCREQGAAPCTHVRALIEARAASIDAQIHWLTQLRQDLGASLERAQAIDPSTCDPTAVCSILDGRASDSS